MIVHRVRAPTELLSNRTNGMALDEQLKHMLLAIGQPRTRVIYMLQRGRSTQTQRGVQGADQCKRLTRRGAILARHEPIEVQQAKV